MQKNSKQFNKDLYDKEIDKRILIDHLKINYSFSDQIKIIKNIPAFFDTLIYGKATFKSVKEIGLKKLTFINSEESEMNWLVHLFTRYAKEINTFIKLKQDYELHFLLGDYKKSKETLNIINKISSSYWGLENEFLQTQYQEGLEFNFKLLTKNKELETNDPAFFYLIHFFSNKVEEDISYFSYINTLENSLNWGMSEDYKRYFFYRLNPINHDYKDIGALLWATSNLSLIDKYTLFKDILANFIPKPNTDDKYLYFSHYCEHLSKYIDDPWIEKANLLINNTSFERIKTNAEENRLISHFFKGQYEECISLCEIIFLKEINLNIIEIYIKSHIHLERDLFKIGKEGSVLNILIRLIHNVLSRNIQSNEAIIELLTMANAISSFDIAKEILTFIGNHISKEQKIENTKFSYLHSKYQNPLNYIIFEERQIEFLKIFKNSNSITAEFFLDLIHTNHSNAKISKCHKSFYIAINYFNKKDFNSCKKEIEIIYSSAENIPYLKEIFIKLKFFCHVNLQEFDKAIDLYVDNYLSNPFIVSKIKSEEFANQIVQQKWKNINNSNINFPIFMYLSEDDIHAKYIAYDLFMRTQNITLPSELNNCEHIELNKKIFFLKNIANQKIISRKAVVFKNSTEVLKERIAICQILSKIDTINIDEYSKEISDITQRLTVQQRIKEIDESKIYIDETGIFEKELNEVNKSFNRFKTISKLLKESNIDATGIGYDALNNLLKGKIDTETYKKSLRKTDIQFELFIQLFLEIRDKFLFSNQYGLDYYLSQRIRHGTIINHIRKSFKNHNLVTTKSSKNDEYLPNSYWVNRLDLEENIRETFLGRMNSFSAEIDNKISNLKNNYIQIRTEDPKTKQIGWFDYMYIPIWDESYLYKLYLQGLQFTINFNDFVKQMFEVLWHMTDRNLSNVRDRMNSVIKYELIKELDLLEKDLKRIIPNKNIPSIYRAIADCRTNVQADIDYAIRWFNKSKNDEIDFTIEDALNTSLQIVDNIISPNYLDVSTKINTKNTLIKGTYFTHFVDLIKIFLTNISDYYLKVEIIDKLTTITLSQNENLLFLEFSNSLKENEDIEQLQMIISKKQSLDQSNNKGIRGEGSTGFPKANNILKNVFRNNTNNISFDITERKFVVKCEILLNNLIV